MGFLLLAIKYLAFYTIDVVLFAPIDLSLNQSMNVSFKTWELLIEISSEAQVINNSTVKTFARNQQRNAGRVRREQDGGNAVFEVVDLDAAESYAVNEINVGNTLVLKPSELTPLTALKLATLRKSCSRTSFSNK